MVGGQAEATPTVGGQSGLGAAIVHGAQDAAQHPLFDGPLQRRGRRVLQGMSFVADDARGEGFVGRALEHAAQEQGVVDDDNVGAVGVLAGAAVEVG